MPAFVNTFYESDQGDIHPMRLTPDYAAVAGTAVAGPANNKIPAKVTKGNREFGLAPRGVRIFRTFSAGGETFKRYGFLPLRTPEDASGDTYAEGASVSIGGTAWTIGAFKAEDYK